MSKKTFKQVLGIVKTSERFKDDFLKVSRLSRHERRLDSEDLMWVLILAMVLLFFFGLFALMILGR